MAESQNGGWHLHFRHLAGWFLGASNRHWFVPTLVFIMELLLGLWSCWSCIEAFLCGPPALPKAPHVSH